jgi:hypothetical protein
MESPSRHEAGGDAVRGLRADLETALVRELAREHEQLSWALFRSRLSPVVIRLVDSRLLGRWVSDERTIEMSRRLCVEEPWGVAVEVLKHEMAHQYVDEVLGIRDETAHGPAFQDLCAKIAIDPRASGMPSASARTEADDRVLSRIAKLLALAESDSEHEAQAAMNAAQRLMLKHNLEASATRARRDYGFRHLGVPRTRVFEFERLLAVILHAHFFVEVIWVSVYLPTRGVRASVLEAVGTRPNLDLAEYVHGFLLAASERLFSEHRQRTRAPRRERQSFLAGVMAGFFAKLNDERKKQQREGLVWVGDADLATFHRKRHPRVQTARFAAGGFSHARESGREAGRALVLHRPVGAAASGGGPKLLGPRR